MRKIITIFLGLLFLLLVSSLIYSNLKVIETRLNFYSIPKNYSIYKSEDKEIIIDIYTNEDNSYISFEDNNKYYLMYNNHIIEINDVIIEKRKELSKERDSIFVYSFYIAVKNFVGEVYKEDLLFKIVNDQYKLTINAGNITLYDKEYELLDFTDLYGNFAYIDEELHLVGITIALDKGYHILNKVEGGMISGKNNFIEKNMMYPPEITISDLKDNNILGVHNEDSFELGNKERYYFIPISYEKLYLSINPCFIFYIDGKKYLLDNFYYLYNSINLSDYQYSRKIGELVYA